MTSTNHTHPIRRRITAGIVALTLAGVLGAGVYWHRTAPMTGVTVAGNQHASTQDILRLAGFDNDSLTANRLLYHIDTRGVNDSVLAHPWVAEVNTARLPTGTLRITVQERTPVALALDVFGEPSHFIDRDGFLMPVMESDAAPSVYDVPLVRGPLDASNATRIERAEIRALMEALATAPPLVDALISEVVLDSRGEATIRTTPAGGHPSLRVIIGRAATADEYSVRLQALRAFYDQAVLSRPERTFDQIDLRFDGQVVTREQ